MRMSWSDRPNFVPRLLSRASASDGSIVAVARARLLAHGSAGAECPRHEAWRRWLPSPQPARCTSASTMPMSCANPSASTTALCTLRRTPPSTGSRANGRPSARSTGAQKSSSSAGWRRIMNCSEPAVSASHVAMLRRAGTSSASFVAHARHSSASMSRAHGITTDITG